MVSHHRALATVIALVLVSSTLQAEQWSRFRGPNGTGISMSTGLPSEFGPDKNVEWSTEIPFARSSPVLAGDRIYLTAVDGDKFSTLALSRGSGEILWQRDVERDRSADLYKDTDSATPSPVTDGANVYAFFQETGLVSYSQDGEKRWEMALGPFRNFYGIAASPILAGDSLLLLCDQAMGSFLLAVDKNTGDELWREPRTTRLESYSTPILYPEGPDPSQILVAGSMWVDAYDIESGKTLWSLDGVGTGPVSSPVLAGDLLFISAPDHAAEPPPSFAELLSKHDNDEDGLLTRAEVEGIWMANHFGFVDVDGDGSLSSADWKIISEAFINDSWGIFGLQLSSNDGQPEILWNIRQSVPYIPTGIAYGGIVYMVQNGIVSAIDPTTGELIKRGRLKKGSPKVYASPVAADGKIYFATLDGEVVVVEAGRDWEVLSVNDLGEEIHASPAIVDGHLYVRTREKLYDFAASDATAPQAP